MTTQEITNNEDILDSRDIFARIEELEAQKEEFILNESALPEEDSPSWSEVAEANGDAESKWNETDEGTELNNLVSFMEQFKGCGGDEQWRGDWYPVTIIRDSYFEEYTEELIKDCGYISKDFPSWIEIDWKGTAENVQQDYTSAEFDGVTYWAR